ncbi:hypothetical protein LINGRAHAP2_LOCUS1985, partial [Linum grandiflorum]
LLRPTTLPPPESSPATLAGPLLYSGFPVLDVDTLRTADPFIAVPGSLLSWVIW